MKFLLKLAKLFKVSFVETDFLQIAVAAFGAGVIVLPVSLLMREYEVPKAAAVIVDAIGFATLFVLAIIQIAQSQKSS